MFDVYVHVFTFHTDIGPKVKRIKLLTV